MQKSDFEAELRSSGYTQIESKALDPKPGNDEHFTITISEEW